MTGFININKAQGVSSAREVAIVKRLSKTPCGHMGTLDPMADGVLPVAVGNAARLFDYFLSKRKTYVATFVFGKDYDTLDVTGRVVADGGRTLSVSEIESVIPSLVGEIMQTPPRYSAKSIGGRRGYELARSGVDFTLPPKKVNIYSIKLLGSDKEGFRFEIECGGGTYIRSIARDMATMLGTFGAMSALTRTASGAFTLENSVKTADLTEENLSDFLIPADSVLPFESVYLSDKEEKKLLNGLSVLTDLEDGSYKIYDTNRSFYGVASVEKHVLKARLKLC